MLKLLHFMDYASMLTLVNWWQTSQQDLGVAFVVGYPSKLNQELSQLINKKTKSFRHKKLTPDPTTRAEIWLYVLLTEFTFDQNICQGKTKINNNQMQKIKALHTFESRWS